MKRMKWLIILLTCLVLFHLPVNTLSQTKIENGILDLRTTGFERKSVIDLNGDWEFYWEKHLRPSDFVSDQIPVPDLYAKVPSYWTDYHTDLTEITATGFATYRLQILLPDHYRNDLLLSVPIFDSSYKLYLNGKYINSNGIAGENPDVSKPGYRPFNYHLIETGDTIEIIINVSNFHHRRGGFWLPLTIGDYEVLSEKITKKSISISIMTGILLASTIFFFLFYLLFREEKSALYFTLVTLGIFLRHFVTGSFMILSFININWTWLIRIEYISSYVALIFSIWYFYTVFRDKLMNFISILITVLLSLCIAIVLITDVSVFSYTMLLFMPVTVIVLGYYTIKSFFEAVRNGREYSILAAGFLAVIIGAISDIGLANSRQILSQNYLLQYTLLFFILTQVLNMLLRWRKTVIEEKRLVSEVEYVNKNLESIVIERTAELTNQKGELEKQKSETEKKNHELEKTILIRNRIFSIIAHDLKAPVANLSILTDLLKNNDNSKIENIPDSISQQAKFASNLIDNLLLWGEGQQNKINYTPVLNNLTDLVLENFNLLRGNSDRKSIKLNYSHKGDSHALCDKDLVNIIIRNLLANAIKFTPAKGNISVTVEESILKDGKVYLIIKDNGIGIDQEKIDKFFINDIITSSPGTDNEKGTGLGLQICNDLIKINKGTMKLESELNKGTTITIMLPAPLH